jgi:hypothetical protein
LGDIYRNVDRGVVPDAANIAGTGIDCIIRNEVGKGIAVGTSDYRSATWLFYLFDVAAMHVAGVMVVVMLKARDRTVFAVFVLPYDIHLIPSDCHDLPMEALHDIGR